MKRAELPGRATSGLWGLLVLNVMAACWMIAAGDWLDRAWAVSSVVTLAGHHEIVLVLAVVAFALLASVAPSTRGFTKANGVELGAIVIAGIVSAVALAGIISVATLVVGTVLLFAHIGRALSRR